MKDLPPSVHRFASAVDSIPAAITLFDPGGRILHANPRALRSLGYSLEEVRGRGMELFFRDSLSPSDADRIKEAALGGGWRGEVLNYRKDGTNFPVYLETNLLRSDAGTVFAVVAVGRDVAEQHAFQERLLAEAKLGTLGVLCHNLTHEVRNRLAAIKLSLYMLETGGEESQGDALHYTIAREEVDRIELFLRSIEGYVHPPTPRMEPSDLLEVVDQGLEDARPLLLSKSITVCRQYPGHPPRVRADRRQLALAVTQVVQNATEAVSPGGEIHVVVKRQPLPEGTWWLVDVRDNGPGISSSLVGRVFEPFFTTDPDRIGLGLSNVWRVLSLHGGSTELYSPSGGGTVVTLRIPEELEGD